MRLRTQGVVLTYVSGTAIGCLDWQKVTTITGPVVSGARRMAR